MMYFSFLDLKKNLNDRSFRGILRTLVIESASKTIVLLNCGAWWQVYGPCHSNSLLQFLEMFPRVFLETGRAAADLFNK